MVSLGKKIYKYFVSYKDDGLKKIPLSIMLPKTSANVKRYDGESKLMFFY